MPETVEKKLYIDLYFSEIYTNVYQKLRAGKCFDRLFSLPVYDNQYNYGNLIIS